jgi:hypothetical protein
MENSEARGAVALSARPVFILDFAWRGFEVVDRLFPVYAGLERLCHRHGARMRSHRRGMVGGVAFEGVRRRVRGAVAATAMIRSDSDGRRAASAGEALEGARRLAGIFCSLALRSAD